MTKNLFIIISLISLFSCTQTAPSPQKFKETRLLMDTFIEISVIHKNKKVAHDAINSAFGEIERLETMMSRFKDTSEVYTLNNSPHDKYIPVSPELFEVIERSIYFSRITEENFDITIGNLMENLWKFNEDIKRVPKLKEIQKYLKSVDYHQIALKEKNMVKFLKKGIMIDVGGIAKGYAVDKGILKLKESGIQNALINAGGDLRTIGERKPGNPWRVGIQHPRNSSEIMGVLNAKDISIATSGDYQRYFEIAGERYHHIINPKTGFPAKGTQSVTILTNTVMDADAISTAVFVMGPKKGLEFIETQKDVEGIIISKAGKKIISSGLKGKIKF